MSSSSNKEEQKPAAKARSSPHPGTDTESDAEEFHDAHFPPEEEAALVTESNDHKSRANNLFTSSRYDEALSVYDQALAFLPTYLDYEIAVLQSNISACHLKLSEWKEAIEAATRSLDRLEAIDPLPKPKKKRSNPRNPTETISASDDANHNNQVVELDSSEDEPAALSRLNLSDARRDAITRIRTKSLLRRARARSSLGTWADLAGAEEDYTLLSANPHLSSSLPPSDQKTVRIALRDLPARVAEAREKDTAEMLGKLKELGNGILKPFGLSTDNFKMVKDEKTGGYSMSFQ